MTELASYNCYTKDRKQMNCQQHKREFMVI